MNNPRLELYFDYFRVVQHFGFDTSKWLAVDFDGVASLLEDLWLVAVALDADRVNPLTGGFVNDFYNRVFRR